MNEVFETETLTKLVATLDANERIWIAKLSAHLCEQISGKSLRGNWLFEKRLGSKRLYFVVSGAKVLLVDFAHKREQQETIDWIVENKERFIAMLNARA